MDISKVEIGKVYKARNIDLIFLVLTVMMMYALVHVKTILEGIMWYLLFIVVCWIHALTTSYLLAKKRFFLKLMDYSIYDAWLPFMIWGIGLFFVLFFFYKGLGATFTWGGVDVMVHQLFVASSETFIFVIFLVEAMPESWGKIPLTKIGIPNWFWASFMFGTFHAFSYNLNLFNMAFAVLMNIIWFKIFKYGEVNKNIGGTAGVIAFHWVWNYLALATTLAIGGVIWAL